MKIQIFVLTFILRVNAEHNAKEGIGYGGLDKYSKTYDRNRSNFYVTNRQVAIKTVPISTQLKIEI